MCALSAEPKGNSIKYTDEQIKIWYFCVRITNRSIESSPQRICTRRWGWVYPLAEEAWTFLCALLWYPPQVLPTPSLSFPALSSSLASSSPRNRWARLEIQYLSRLGVIYFRLMHPKKGQRSCIIECGYSLCQGITGQERCAMRDHPYVPVLFDHIIDSESSIPFVYELGYWSPSQHLVAFLC